MSKRTEAVRKGMLEGLHLLTREHFGISLDELEKVTEAREVWASLLRLLPPRP